MDVVYHLLAYFIGILSKTGIDRYLYLLPYSNL